MWAVSALCEKQRQREERERIEICTVHACIVWPFFLQPLCWETNFSAYLHALVLHVKEQVFTLSVFFNTYNKWLNNKTLSQLDRRTNQTQQSD